MMARAPHTASPALRRRTGLLFIAGFAPLAAAVFASIAFAAGASNIAREADDLLSAWQQADAARLLSAHAGVADAGPEITYAQARLAFVRGDYAGAERLIGEAIAKGGERAAWEGLRALAKRTREALGGYQEFRSQDGRVVVRWSPGKDALLVPYVVEAMDAIIRGIGGDFGFAPEEPVLVELYPGSEILAQVSPLTEKDIERTGTIALCKYQRLMVTTPRAMLRGYGWLDTLAHEFIHYAVTKVSKNSVPIWLHEGLAKWAERRWRGPAPRKLSPQSEHLLASALKKRKLITFEQMHPSMAKLPSQEDAALAFAEVQTVIDYIHSKVGMEGIRSILRLMRDGKSDADAISLVLHTSFGAFKKAWMRYLKGLRLRTHPGIVPEKLELKKKGKKKKDDLKDIKLERARDLTKLGDLLRLRQHLRAAAVEYRKAARLAKNRFPTIETKLARTLLLLQKPKEAADALEPTLALYPGDAATYLYLGEAHMALADVERAIVNFEESARINPFNPRIHEALSDLYRRKGDDARSQRAMRNLRILRGEAGEDPFAPTGSLPK